MPGEMSFAVRATDCCNLNCKYCYARVSNPQTMTTEVMTRVLGEIARHCAGQRIVISWTGGEPLLMGKSFFDRIVQTQAVLGQDFSNILQTNGVLLEETWYGFLLQHRFQVRTSLDLPPELHDEMRLRGNFEKTLAKIERLRQLGIPINVNTVITDRNIGNAAEIYRFLKRHGIRSFSVSRLVMQGNALQNQQLAIRQNVEFGRFLVQLFDLWVNDHEELCIERITPLDKLLNACRRHLQADGIKDPCFHCQDQLLAIGPTGDVYPSCNKFFGVPESCLGNLSSLGLTEVLESPARQQFLREVGEVTTRLCAKCEFMPICEGGCYYVSYAARPQMDEITQRSQFCKGYYVILAHIMAYLGQKEVTQ